MTLNVFLCLPVSHSGAQDACRAWLVVVSHKSLIRRNRDIIRDRESEVLMVQLDPFKPLWFEKGSISSEYLLGTAQHHQHHPPWAYLNLKDQPARKL